MPAAPSLQLKPVEVTGLPATIPIPFDGLAIGRDPGNGLVLDRAQFPHVSSFHARFTWNEDALFVEDLGTKNGTLVNGQSIERIKLAPGDVLQIGGTVGPRFLIVPAVALDATMSAIHVNVHGDADAVGGTTIRFRETVRSHSRKILLAVVAMFLLLGAGLVVALLSVEKSARDVDKLLVLKKEIAADLSAAKEQINAQKSAWSQHEANLGQERQRLVDQIARLERGGVESTAEVKSLREKLVLASQRLDQLKPISLEELESERQKALEKLVSAVVFIEVRTFYQDPDSGRVLYVEREGGKRISTNMDERGDPYSDETSGSGFCFSPDGWIATNAHVVRRNRKKRRPSFVPSDLEPKTTLAVVFSGTSTRHPARLIKQARRKDIDVALLKIDRFADMPHFEQFDLAVQFPAPGSQLRIFGFPYGKDLQDDGYSVSALVFLGVVSRIAEPFVQVQAAIYPGNSGGPVVDTQGRVVGLVTSVQQLPSGQISSIGYVLPIARLGEVWPPDEP